MASSKVQLTDPVKETLGSMNPDERKLVVGVLRLLEDDIKRDTGKFNLCYSQEDGKPTWGFAESIIWVAFAEEDDGTITIVHVTLISRFRTPWPGDR